MENYSYIFGVVQPGMFIAMVIFSAIGVTMALLGDAQTRDQNSPSTPEKFSFLFLLKDNWKTILLSFLAVILSLRFAPILFPDQFTTDALSDFMGKEKWLFGSFMIGLLFNGLLQLLKSKADILKVKR
jgi:hypothetical protein